LTLKRSPIRRRTPVRRAKFGNIPREYKGIEYHSQKEANYAAELDLRTRSTMAVDRIEGWERQVSIRLEVNGKLICRFVCDFLVHHLDGRIEYVEVKGYPTPEWRIKEKLFRAIYPDRKLTVVL
jgi:hypothetical protein